ncbi:nicotinate (nicotinamide) nucleotide adenylyltransferase [Bacteroidota bacterium]
MNIGLFFGSFNPIHQGHLIIANIMVESANLDEVWFVVSPLNPFKKSSRSLIHEFDRIDMVELAIEDNSVFKASDIEFHLPKPSYTIDTLTHFAEKHPTYSFNLIIGEDNLAALKKWKNSDAILENFTLLVYPRPNAEQSELRNHPMVKIVEAPLLDISATFIRKCIKNHRSVKYLIHEKVYQFIRDRKLYLN